MEQKTRLSQRGLLKRFGPKCIGKQETFESLRLKKSNLHKKIKKGTEEWDFYFLKYIPSENKIKSKNNKTNIVKKTSKRSSKKTSKKSSTFKKTTKKKAGKFKKKAGKLKIKTFKYKKINTKKVKQKKFKKKYNVKGWLGNIGY